MLRVTVLLSAMIVIGCLETQVRGEDNGKAKPHMLSYANSYGGSYGGMFPGFYGGMNPYSYRFGMGFPYGGMGYGMGMGMGMGMSPFSMYSAGKSGKTLPKG